MKDEIGLITLWCYQCDHDFDEYEDVWESSFDEGNEEIVCPVCGAGYPELDVLED
jgi:DNA-directed RNA polymerase subunit RPC12/RpoP